MNQSQEAYIKKEQVKARLTELFNYFLDKQYLIEQSTKLTLCLKDKDKGIWVVYDGLVIKKRAKKLKVGSFAECQDFIIERYYRKMFTGFEKK